MKKLIPLFAVALALVLPVSLSSFSLQAEDSALPIPVYEIEGSLYHADAADSIRTAMTANSEQVISRMRSDISSVVERQTSARLANVDAFLDWYFGYLTSYEKAVRTISGSIEIWEEENFDRIINTGVDTATIPEKFAMYQKEVMNLAASYAVLLRESRAGDNGEQTALAGTMDTAEFFAPFTAMRVLDSIAVGMGLETKSFLTGNAALLSRVFSGIQLASFPPLVVATKPVVSNGVKTVKALFSKLSGKYFGKALAKIAAGAATKTVGKAAATGGAAVIGGLLGGPVGLGIGIAVGIIADLGIDYGANKLNELWNRDKMKVELETAILAEQDSLLAALSPL
jgi:hypothetical protein